MRCATDKNNGQFSVPLSNAFNETIQDLQLSEVELSDRLYTWTNGQPHPILAWLDRVFTNNDLDLIFPLTSLSSLPKPTLDHTPLLLSLSTSLPKSGFFRFERAWLRHQSFLPTVLAGWQQTHERADAAGHLASCIKSTRAAAKVWSRCIRPPNYLIPNYKFIIQLFDFFEEMRPLSAHEFQARKQTQQTLQDQIKAKAAYWKQRSKQRAIKECDSNTAFHHAHATQRLRSNYSKKW